MVNSSFFPTARNEFSAGGEYYLQFAPPLSPQSQLKAISPPVLLRRDSYYLNPTTLPLPPTSSAAHQSMVQNLTIINPAFLDGSIQPLFEPQYFWDSHSSSSYYRNDNLNDYSNHKHQSAPLGSFATTGLIEQPTFSTLPRRASNNDNNLKQSQTQNSLNGSAMTIETMQASPSISSSLYYVDCSGRADGAPVTNLTMPPPPPTSTGSTSNSNRCSMASSSNTSTIGEEGYSLSSSSGDASSALSSNTLTTDIQHEAGSVGFGSHHSSSPLLPPLPPTASELRQALSSFRRPVSTYSNASSSKQSKYAVPFVGSSSLVVHHPATIGGNKNTTPINANGKHIEADYGNAEQQQQQHRSRGETDHNRFFNAAATTTVIANNNNNSGELSHEQLTLMRRKHFALSTQQYPPQSPSNVSAIQLTSFSQTKPNERLLSDNQSNNQNHYSRPSTTTSMSSLSSNLPKSNNVQLVNYVNVYPHDEEAFPMPPSPINSPPDNEVMNDTVAAVELSANSFLPLPPPTSHQGEVHNHSSNTSTLKEVNNTSTLFTKRPTNNKATYGWVYQSMSKKGKAAGDMSLEMDSTEMTDFAAGLVSPDDNTGERPLSVVVGGRCDSNNNRNSCGNGFQSGKKVTASYNNNGFDGKDESRITTLIPINRDNSLEEDHRIRANLNGIGNDTMDRDSPNPLIKRKHTKRPSGIVWYCQTSLIILAIILLIFILFIAVYMIYFQSTDGDWDWRNSLKAFQQGSPFYSLMSTIGLISVSGGNGRGTEGNVTSTPMATSVSQVNIIPVTQETTTTYHPSSTTTLLSTTLPPPPLPTTTTQVTTISAVSNKLEESVASATTFGTITVLPTTNKTERSTVPAITENLSTTILAEKMLTTTTEDIPTTTEDIPATTIIEKVSTMNTTEKISTTTISSTRTTTTTANILNKTDVATTTLAPTTPSTTTKTPSITAISEISTENKKVVLEDSLFSTTPSTTPRASNTTISTTTEGISDLKASTLSNSMSTSSIGIDHQLNSTTAQNDNVTLISTPIPEIDRINSNETIVNSPISVQTTTTTGAPEQQNLTQSVPLLVDGFTTSGGR